MFAPTHMVPVITYSDVIEYCNWLEDAHHGRFSRFALDGEDSLWVDHQNECIIDDPLEVLCKEDDDA